MYTGNRRQRGEGMPPHNHNNNYTWGRTALFNYRRVRDQGHFSS